MKTIHQDLRKREMGAVKSLIFILIFRFYYIFIIIILIKPGIHHRVSNRIFYSTQILSPKDLTRR